VIPGSTEQENDRCACMWSPSLRAWLLELYSLLGVRSSAPPVVSLVGLLGILGSEQALALVKRIATGAPIDFEWMKSECAPHIFGRLPTRAWEKVLIHER
jgi:XapX domain-containing protein